MQVTHSEANAAYGSRVIQLADGWVAANASRARSPCASSSPPCSSPRATEAPKETAKRYQLQGQILAVNTDKRELTISHGDIPNFMPAMTMIYPVANPKLLEGRTPGETISAVLEVENNLPRLVDITHTGTAPLANGANKAGMAAGVLDVGDAVPDVALIDQQTADAASASGRYARRPDVHLHALSAAGFLPAHGSEFRDAAAAAG